MVLTDDQGAFGLEKIRKELPSQYINVGIAEQNLISVAAGLALGGKRPFVYGISTFMVFRCFEQIRVDVCCMNLPVTILGSGPGYTYGSDGPTHHATQDLALMRVLPEMTILDPADAVSTGSFAQLAYTNSGPTYIRLEKGTVPRVYEFGHDFSQGFEVLGQGKDLMIVATGIMVQRAMIVADQLAENGLDVGVVDLYRVKPVDPESLCLALNNTRAVAALEENSIVGGIGSLIAETLADQGVAIPVKRIAAPDRHTYQYGDRDWLHALNGLDDGAVTRILLDWMNDS